MSKLLGVALGLLIAVVTPLATLADNTYPIVLVHGFTGWGRDELGGVKYWGGLQGDLQEELEAQGYTVFTAVVGPFSSNWDRTCELYAQIKGGQVDYGAVHSTTHDHDRYGRNFTGLYPEWGEENADGSVNKIHLIGHSQGGQTSRMLTQMLQKGTAGAPTEEEPSSHPLFAGGHDWVHSITTVSTPNQGTTLADGVAELGNLVVDLLIGLLSVIDIAGTSVDAIYDAKLDQFGISPRQDDETISAYLTRVTSSPIFAPGFTDICLYSLTTTAAKEESTWVETLDNVYYYSFASIDTYSAYNWKLQKISFPNIFNMLLILDPFSIFLGSRYAPDDDGLTTDWQPNDGVVNTVSMHQDYVGELVEFDGTAQIGKWNKMAQLTDLDHLGMLGFTLFQQVFDVYLAQAELLASLPVDTTSATRRMLEDGASNATNASMVAANASINAAITTLTTATGQVQTAQDMHKLCTNVPTAVAASYCKRMFNITSSITTENTRRLRG
ncbi:hypothetical protein BBJ28_00012376 [Nothophytophthora sp. Chile5]|nr:hypothetical protein BBJ28_00012376 [Nothophytophthora sp. Chile5]